jgi:hypothetical protein
MAQDDIGQHLLPVHWLAEAKVLRLISKGQPGDAHKSQSDLVRILFKIVHSK